MAFTNYNDMYLSDSIYIYIYTYINTYAKISIYIYISTNAIHPFKDLAFLGTTHVYAIILQTRARKLGPLGPRMLDILLLTILTEKDEVERTSALVFLEEHGKSLVWDEESGHGPKPSASNFQIIPDRFTR